MRNDDLFLVQGTALVVIYIVGNANSVKDLTSLYTFHINDDVSSTKVLCAQVNFMPGAVMQCAPFLLFCGELVYHGGKRGSKAEITVIQHPAMLADPERPSSVRGLNLSN